MINDFKKKLVELLPKYDNLGKNIVQVIALLLEKHNIKYVSVDYRIKETESILEKIERKGYNSPESDLEDICGIRVICYYQSDLDKIYKIITNEFKIHNSEDKVDSLEQNQFGYRSRHVIVGIKKSWLQVPNYRTLENLKAEIQIRTILMHAWAEIEHNLSYKKESHIPSQFKRKLFRISAKLEEADEQFEDLKKESRQFQKELLENAQEFTHKTILNLDTLQAFLDFHFPDRNKNTNDTANLLDELIKFKVTFKEILNGYKKIGDRLEEIEKEVLKKASFQKFAQVGIMRTILDFTTDNYLDRLPNGEIKQSRKRLKEKYT